MESSVIINNHMKGSNLLFQSLLIAATLALGLSLHMKVDHDSLGTSVQSNLSVENWFYGGLTEKELKQSVFEEMTKNFNILKCNTEAPFWNG